jgi:hypothetical protein
MITQLSVQGTGVGNSIQNACLGESWRTLPRVLRLLAPGSAVLPNLLFVIILYSAACGYDIHFPPFTRFLKPTEETSKVVTPNYYSK